MRFLRIAWRVPALAGITLILAPWSVFGSFVIGLVRGGGWDGPRTAAHRTRTFHRWSRVCCAIMGVRIRVDGRPPEAPFFLVTNHLGYLDIAILSARVPSVFVSKAEVEHWPVVGLLCKIADTLFIDRRNKRDIPRVIREIEHVLEGDRGIVVFPEGSSTMGAEVQRFRPSLLQAAAEAGIPVSYAALSYRTPEGSAPAHESVCWWGDMTFADHFVDLLGLPRIEARISFGADQIQERDRKRLAQRLQEAVEQVFHPVVPETEQA